MPIAKSFRIYSSSQNAFPMIERCYEKRGGAIVILPVHVVANTTLYIAELTVAFATSCRQCSPEYSPTTYAQATTHAVLLRSTSVTPFLCLGCSILRSTAENLLWDRRCGRGPISRESLTTRNASCSSRHSIGHQNGSKGGAGTISVETPRSQSHTHCCREEIYHHPCT